MSSWAKPGVKCVCVDDAWPAYLLERGGVSRVPMIHEVLTVSRVEDGGYLTFLEIPEYQGARRSVRWTVDAFRPLVTRTQQQDVELFRSLLTDLPVGIEA